MCATAYPMGALSAMRNPVLFARTISLGLLSAQSELRKGHDGVTFCVGTLGCSL